MRVREAFQADLAAMRDEMDAASRRATLAESELDLLRGSYAELEEHVRSRGDARPKELTSGPPPEVVRPLQIVTNDPDNIQGTSTFTRFRERMSDDTERLLAAASTAAARLHSQAEIDLARARDKAVAVLAKATQEAEDLLSAAVTAIERDTALADATREQARRDGEVAATARQEAEMAATVIRRESEDAAATLRREAEEAAAALRRQAEASLASASADARRLRDESRHEAERLLVDAEREASEVLIAVRRQLASEISALCDAADRTRDSVEQFLEATTASSPFRALNDIDQPPPSAGLSPSAAGWAGPTAAAADRPVNGV